MGSVADWIEFIRSWEDTGYVIIFVILCFCGLGLPVSKDAVLFAAGVVAGISDAAPNVSMLIAFVLCFFGVVIGDCIMYAEGRFLGPGVQKIRPVKYILTPKRFALLQKYYKRYGFGMIIFARFVPVSRGPIYIFCGMTRRIHFSKFLLINSAATFIYTGMWIIIGAAVGNNLDKIAATFDRFKLVFITAALAVLTAAIIWLLFRKQFRNNSEK
jgi:membrane protein DedA with SNARE-associated domain